VRTLAPRAAAAVPVEELAVSSAQPARRARRQSVSGQDGLHVPLETAAVVLCVGSRLDQRVAEQLHQTAKANRWGFACTSGTAELFQLPHENELSIATHSIAPTVFIGFELDDPQDLAPVQSAGLVVTVDSESRPSQPAADVTVIGDAAAFAAALSAAAVGGRLEVG
jgi:electron transfer flavoprotein alpha subunit